MGTWGTSRFGATAPWVVAIGLLVPAAVDAAIGTPQLLGTIGARTAATATSLVVTSPVPAGDTVIVSAALDPVAGAVGCADTAGNAYTVDADATRGSGVDGVRTIVCSATLNAPLAGGVDAVSLSHPSTPVAPWR